MRTTTFTLIVGEVAVLDYFKRIEDDEDVNLFTLPCHHSTVIYQQAFHGSVNMKTKRIYLDTSDPEAILRGTQPPGHLELADEAINIFAQLTGITTVRHKFLSRQKRADLTSSGYWQRRTNTKLKTTKLTIRMLGAETTYNHRFDLQQLPPKLCTYIDKESIVLGYHRQSVSTRPGPASRGYRVRRRATCSRPSRSHRTTRVLDADLYHTRRAAKGARPVSTGYIAVRLRAE